MSARRQSCLLSLSFWAGFHQLTFRISNYVFFSRWVFGRVAGARCVVLNLDDVLHWSPIPEMHEEVADVKRVRCSGSTSGPNCSMTHAFCPLMTHDGCGASKQVVVPDFWWLVARGAANDSESRFVFLLQFWHLWQLPNSFGRRRLPFRKRRLTVAVQCRCCASRT